MAIQNWPKTSTSGDWASVDGINFAEGQAAQTVNDSARAMGRDVAKWRDDINSSITTTGSSNAYVLTSNASYGSLSNGFQLCFKASFSNTGAATLNVDGLGAKSIRKFSASGEAALAANDIVNGGHYWVQYNTAVNAAAGGWVLFNPSSMDGANLTALSVPTAAFAADAVTYAKIQNISATQRLLGRNTSGSGDTEEVTATQALDWLGSTRGQILYRNATVWTPLAPGTSGQFLKTNGAGADPSWGNAGVIVGRAYVAYTSNADLSTTVPIDDTVPTISEGTEVVTISYTPASSTNRIRVSFNGTVASSSTAITAVASIFADSTNIAVGATGITSSTVPFSIVARGEYVPGSTSAITFSVRVGSSATIRMNGTVSARLFGGNLISALVIEEIQA